MITSERGLVLKPYGDWDGISTDDIFEVTVKMDSDYAKYLDTKRWMIGSVVYLNGAQVTFRSSTQKTFSLLTIKAELNAEVMGLHDASFMKNIVKSLGLYWLALIMAGQ